MNLVNYTQLHLMVNLDSARNNIIINLVLWKQSTQNHQIIKEIKIKCVQVVWLGGMAEEMSDACNLGCMVAKGER